MNMYISDVSYFSIPCCEDLAQKLEEIFVANQFCIKKTSINDKASKVNSFAKSFLINFQKWVMDFRFCDEDFDFIIRFPWFSFDSSAKKVILSEKIHILRTADSDENKCREVVREFIKVFWDEFFIYPVRDTNIGPVPDTILYLEEGGKKNIPGWYVPKAAFFKSLNNGGDPVACWLAGEKELISQGYVFASQI